MLFNWPHSEIKNYFYRYNDDEISARCPQHFHCKNLISMQQEKLQFLIILLMIFLCILFAFTLANMPDYSTDISIISNYWNIEFVTS